MGSLLEQIRKDEGFRSKPYRDSRGVWTIGYGTNIGEGITVKEAEWLLKERIDQVQGDIARRWAPLERLPLPVQEALVGMGYQLGVDGMLRFRKMLAALAESPPDYDVAILEARDSAWQRETPHRVQRLVTAFKMAAAKPMC